MENRILVIPPDAELGIAVARVPMIGVPLIHIHIGSMEHLAVKELEQTAREIELAFVKPFEIKPRFQLREYSEESKKSRPCTYHEYTLRVKRENEKTIEDGWKCKHCEHPLK